MKRYLLFFLLSVTAAQQIPPNDPIYLYLRQEFRKTHDLSLFVQPYPFSLTHFKGLRLSPQKQNGYFRIAPSIISSKEIPDLRFGIWVFGSWGNLSILAEPVLVNEYYGESVLGETYERAGFTGRFENAFIQFKTQNTTIQFGRKPIWWGQSWESSVIKSGKSPPYDHVSIQFNLNYLYLELLAGQLHSGRVASIGRFKRFIGGKKLSFLSKSGRFLLTIGDLILYSGINRSIEWQYLNPIIPYFFSDLEKEAGDNDNNMIFFNGRVVATNHLSAYFELLIDDFQMDIENRNVWPDALGWKIGLDGSTPAEATDLGFEVEYTRISGYTYITREWFTNWEDRGIPIGYKYGPDCQSIFLLVDRWLNSNWLLSIRYTYLEKGALTLQSEWDPYGTVDDPFPSIPVSYSSYFNPSISYHSKYGIVDAGWDGDLNDVKNGSFYVKAQLVWGFGFDLE